MGTKKERTLTMVGGTAMSGKTGTGNHIGDRLGIKVLDIDDLRALCFVAPHHLEPTEENNRKSGKMFKAAYDVLPSIIEQQLVSLGEPYIVIAGLSIPEGRQKIVEVARRCGARLRIIWTRNSPELLSDEEIQKMIDIKCQNPDYKGTLGNVHGVAHVREQRIKFIPIAPDEVPGGLLVLDTWPTNTVEESYRIALEYCKDPTTGFVFVE